MRGVSIKPAQWKYWVEMKDVELIEAVLLSVNIDPRFVPQNFKRPDTPRVTIPGFSDLDEKTDIALNHFGDKRFERADLRKRVKLAEFRAWAEGLRTPWKLPDEFPRAEESRELSGAQMASEDSPKRLDDFGVYLRELIRTNPSANRDELWTLAINDAQKPSSARPSPLCGYAESEIKWESKGGPDVSMMSRKIFLARLNRLGID